MVVALGLYTLLRDQDMAALRVGDVDLNTGHIRTTITKSKTTDDVAISGDLDPEVRRWLTAYQSRIGTLHPDMFLVPRQRASRVRNDLTGRYIDGRTVGMPGEYVPFGQIRKLSYIVTPLIELMGYPVVDDNGNSLREGAHTLRRSGARAYYDYFVAQGRADALRVVQTMLHHKNSLMTQHYIGLREDRATRDELVRGVTIFGLHNLSRIGVADHGGEEGQRAVL
jgi:integrase